MTLPAQAGSLTRTFVSSAGSDTNPCTIAAPCATFAHAYAAVAANGIVAALDPGKYGPLTITAGITINGNGWAAITAPASGDGITINAGASDKIELTGLEIDGAGVGANGINFNSGGSLTVSNCVLQNFVGGGPNIGNGIIIEPTSGTVDFVITDTTAANNGYVGISYFPPLGGTPNASGAIDHVVAIANHFGILVNSGATSGGSTVVTVSNSVASNNHFDGIFAGSGPGTSKLSIDNVSLSGNDSFGIEASSTASILLGRSVITGNSTGISNTTSPNTLYTYKDNRIDLNGTNIVGSALNTSLALH